MCYTLELVFEYICSYTYSIFCVCTVGRLIMRAYCTMFNQRRIEKNDRNEPIGHRDKSLKILKIPTKKITFRETIKLIKNVLASGSNGILKSLAIRSI